MDNEVISDHLPKPDHTFDRSLIHGIAWTGIAKWASQVLAWSSTLIVARILSPDDYGLVSLAALYLGFLDLVSDLGMGTAIVTLTNLTTNHIAQLNTLSIIVGFLGFVLCCAAALPLGHFFASPRLPLVLVVMALGFIIDSFQCVPVALLQKELRFKSLSLIDATKSVVLAVVTITFAILGFGYWTLVYGALASALLGTFLTLRQRRHGFSAPRMDSLKQVLRFSSDILITRVAWYGYSNADFIVAGKMLGQASLGAYTFAWTLANIPVEKVTSMIGNVTPAFFSSLQEDREKLSRYFLNLTEAIALLTFPAAFGLALVAPEFVHTFLGTKWDAAIVPLRLLAVYVSIRSVAPLLPHVLTVTGQTRFNMWLFIVFLVIFPPAFYIGSRWGTVGIALAWVVLYPVVNLPLYSRVLSVLRMSGGRYYRAIHPAATCSLLMIVCVVLVKIEVPGQWNDAYKLSLVVFTGIVSYCGAVLLFFRHRVLAMYSRVRQAY